MKKAAFQNIGLIARTVNPKILETLETTINYLQSKNINLFLETATAKSLKKTKLPIANFKQLGNECDLLIVVGGDGSLLGTARNIVDYNIPVLGINRGSLGFLTEIKPAEVKEKMDQILKGDYSEEERFLLEVFSEENNKIKNSGSALNEIVLTAVDPAQMIEFEIYIDNKFMCSQRSDGIIIATPTGSTAYALSAGGPILSPNLNAVVLIPMFPHTLSNRPIVLDSNRTIKLIVSKKTKIASRIHCDSQLSFDITTEAPIYIQKKKQPLRLIHAIDYDYFETLRCKLGWGQHLIGTTCELE